MFNDEITSSDAFLDMPSESQNLYFHLGMNADDDGFIANPKTVQRIIGSSDDSFGILFLKKFLIKLDRGVCVIKHWKINNTIRRDFYRETRYSEEKASLYIRENGAYTTNPAGAMPVPRGHFALADLPLMLSVDGSSTDRQRSIGQYSIVKDSIDIHMSAQEADPVIINQPLDDGFDHFWTAYPNKELKKRAKEIWSRKKFSRYLPEILAFIEAAKQTDRWKKGFVKQPPAFLNGECWNDDLASYGQKANLPIGTPHIVGKYANMKVTEIKNDK